MEPAHVEIVTLLSKDGVTVPCPRLCGGSINIRRDPAIEAMATDGRLKQPISLNAFQVYQAVNGMGMPDEIPKDVKTIEAMLLSSKVIEVDVVESDGRFYLNELRLANGITIHLASGLRGAQVLKLTKDEINGLSTSL